MELFYSTNIENGFAKLSEEESYHCVKILRHKASDIIHFTDGKGSIYDGRINKADPKKCEVYILNTVSYTHNVLCPHIAIAPTKNIDRIEFFVEKAIEIGVSKITFLKCERSERKEIKLDRLQKIAISAMKQSKRAFLPVLNPMISFKQFLAESASGDSPKYIACLTNHDKISIKDLKNIKEDPLFLIGPEGDFSPKEVDAALQNKFKPLGLGNTILRTETAGILVCSWMQWIKS